MKERSLTSITVRFAVILLLFLFLVIFDIVYVIPKWFDSSVMDKIIALTAFLVGSFAIIGNYEEMCQARLRKNGKRHTENMHEK